ncbi:MAG: hypothetical protein ACREL4_07155 [Gemmatimonadales bacterium]
MTINKDKPWVLARRVGLAGLLFFVVKGVLWLSVPLLLTMKGCRP